MAEQQEVPARLSKDTTIHVVLSVLSGAQQAQSYYDTTLEPYLRKHGIDFQTSITTSAESITELTNDVILPKALHGVKQTIILLSGDGGVIDIVNTLANATILQDSQGNKGFSGGYVKPVICVIPQGTANALAWSSNIAADPLTVLMQGTAQPIPMFEASFSPGAQLVLNEGTALQPFAGRDRNASEPRIFGAVVFSWGLHASLVERSDTKEYRKHGIERFKMAAGELIKENHAYDGDISIQDPGTQVWQRISSSLQSTAASRDPQDHDSTTAKGRHDSDTKDEKLLYLAAVLVSNLEQHYCIAPNHTPLSDELHIVYIPHLPAGEIGELTYLPYQKGEHVKDPRVLYRTIDGLKIEMNESDPAWRMVCVDGKIVSLEEGGWAKVKRMGSMSVADIVVPKNVEEESLNH